MDGFGLTIQIISVAISAIATGVIAILTWTLVGINRRLVESNVQLTWFTGAMESHSTTRLMMEAQDRKIPIVWWDPNMAPWPREPQVHGQPARVRKITLGIAPERRVRTKARMSSGRR